MINEHNIFANLIHSRFSQNLKQFKNVYKIEHNKYNNNIDFSVTEFDYLCRRATICSSITVITSPLSCPR